MGFNRFALNIVIRSLLITGNAILIALLLQNRNWIFTFIFFCFVLIIQVYLFIRYTGRVNRDLANFLIHIKEQDTTMKFASNSLDKTFKGLSREFQRINKEFQKVKSEQIQKQHLLNLLLDRVGTGILIVNNNFETELLNKAFIRIFDIDSEYKNIWQKIEFYLPDIKKLRAGEQKIETIHVNKLNRKILISLSEVHENSGILKIFSFHDIDREITDYELQSWNGLIKVVSHEIMNTITPMSTVVETIKDCHTINNIEKETHQLTKKDIYDTLKSINLLENRLNSLKNFISRFRLFSDIPSPDLKMFELNGYLKMYIDLYRKNNPSIQFSFKTETEKIIIHADSDLLGLVLNNLIKNATESLTNNPNPRIEFKTGKNNETVYIDISDNGNGIEPGLIKKVFMPFFTTKKDGSGIGLSISRQIMFLHHGTIELKSDEAGTSVRLLFIQKTSS
jgi:nitrogen fixation/metabolism regulation signal transduction histidine kinase